MIIAEIGNTKFVLDSIESAEKILRILSSAKQITECYIGADMARIAYEDPSHTAIEISIKGDIEIKSFDEAMRLKNANKKTV